MAESNECFEYLGLWLLHVTSGIGYAVRTNVFGAVTGGWKGVGKGIDLGGVRGSL